MELVVEAHSYEHAKYCIEIGIKNLILGSSLFACRLSYDFNESEIQELINNRKNTNIWIKVNRFFFEQEINRLTMYLNWLSSLEISKVIFQDYAIAQINKEQKLNLNLLYNPETLVTSYGQFPFYQENDINAVFVAREITWKEFETIAKNKNQMQLMIHGFGYGFIMHSRWKLITNFIDHYHLNDVNQDFLLIKENLRKLPNVLFQDDSGTHMLTGYVIHTLNLINKFNELNLDFLLIDFIKLNTSDNIINEITKIYHDASASNHDHEWYIKQQETVDNMLTDIICSNGFYDCPKAVLHLEKDDNGKK